MARRLGESDTMAGQVNAAAAEEINATVEQKHTHTLIVL
jgi:hypothetical protein